VGRLAQVIVVGVLQHGPQHGTAQQCIWPDNAVPGFRRQAAGAAFDRRVLKKTGNQITSRLSPSFPEFPEFHSPFISNGARHRFFL
jgi:hypothetical protein